MLGFRVRVLGLGLWVGGTKGEFTRDPCSKAQISCLLTGLCVSGISNKVWNVDGIAPGGS